MKKPITISRTCYSIKVCNPVSIKAIAEKKIGIHLSSITKKCRWKKEGTFTYSHNLII